MRSRRHPSAPLSAPVVLAVLAVLWVSFADRPAHAAEPSRFGINIHAPAGRELELLLDRAQAAGLGWVRIDFVWAYVEPVRDRFDWGLYDAIVAEAGERGIEVFASLAYTPAWATSGQEMIGVPDDPEQWADFCFRAARRYQGKIRYWGLWNEPNLDHFWAGTRQQYVDLILRRGADAIRRGNPQAQVGGPELAHLTSGDSDWYEWLRDILEQAGNKLDFVTHHVYDNDGPKDVTDRLRGSTVFGRRPDLWGTVTPTVEEVLKYTGWWGKPFWLTETGWESERVTEATQAAHYRGFLNEWFTGREDRDWIDKVFFYEMKDGTAADSPSWGILRPNGSAKPAYDVYRQFTAERAAARSLRLQGGRFLVEASWRDPRSGNSGYAQPIADSDQSGFFWFFDAANVELVVKVLDGRGVNGHYWFFYGALSDVEYWIDVTDTATGVRKTYHNPPGNLCGRGDIGAFPVGAANFSAPPLAAAPAPVLQTEAAGTCVEDAHGLCLFGSRFRVTVEWRDPNSGNSGRGAAIPRTDQSGTFWFFDPSNVELVVKVLDGRPLTGKFWVFYGALSDVEYWITVTDTVTGAQKQYHNPPGNLCGKGDTAAL